MITVYIENDFGKDRDIEIFDAIAHSICVRKHFAAHEKITCQIECNSKNRGEIMIRSSKNITDQKTRPRWFNYAWIPDQTKINFKAP